MKEDVFDGPQIRELLWLKKFEATLNEIERKDWLNFRWVYSNFLGNNHDPQYKNGINNCWQHIKIGCRMYLKLHFLYSHLDFFPATLGRVSDEQGARFYQDIWTVETRYRSLWNESMMADDCWMLYRNVPSIRHSRKSHTSHF